MLKTLINKEMKVELRTKQTFTSMLILGIVLIFLFSISMGKLDIDAPITFFWVIMFLISSFGLYRSYQNEKDMGSFLMTTSSPVDPSIIYLAKVMAFFIQITIIQLLLAPIAFFFLKINLDNYLLLFILSLGANLFLSVLGNIICSMTLHSKNNEMIIPILLFPFSTPVLLSVIKSTAGISEGAMFSIYSNWIFLIIASVIVFLIIGIWSYNDIIKE
tara:strand:- start:822 stop:1472 length:651 start_codon:yes stop_codon:yes gene_type:complete